MKSELLIDALDYLDDDLLEKAALLRMKPVQKHSVKRPGLFYGSLAAAACLCLMLTASFVLNGFLFRFGFTSDNSKEFSGGLQEAPANSIYAPNAADGIAAESCPLENATVFFDGVILELHENYIIAEPAEGSELFSRDDKIMVSTDAISADELLRLTPGKTVRIVYDGTILDSDPPQISAVAVFDIGESGAD